MTAKKIISLLLALLMLVSVIGLAVSCKPDDQPAGDPGTGGEGTGNGEGGNNNQPEKGLDYTVTLVDIFGQPIEGITLKLTYGDEATEVLTSGADGKVTKKIDTYEDVIVEFVELGNYGNLAKNQRNLNGDTEKTLTLPTKATVTVVDEEGNPVEGVTVQICHNVCLTPNKTNAEGKLSVGISSTEKVKVAILSVPEGYGIPEKVGEYQGVEIHAYFTEGVYELTVTLPNA